MTTETHANGDVSVHYSAKLMRVQQLNYGKDAARATIATSYIMFATFQLATLMLTRPEARGMLGLDPSLPAMKAIGLPELMAHLNGETSLDEAMDHIERWGSRHTDAIVTNHHGNAMRFLREVDSSSVMVNASTRFADGFEFGLGAEIGISTNKLHARGPVGLEGLTSQKWVVFGSGQVRS